jgi:Carbohydrate esterase, sialic acid-specific acetylesterase
MKTILCIFFFAFFITDKCFSQYSIGKFPSDFQLYPRDNNNEAIVTIRGTATIFTYNKVILKVFKNDILEQTLEQNVLSNSFIFNFDITIKAELSEYSFKLYMQDNTSQILVKQANRVVCGDAILLYGQSNMVVLLGVDEFNANNSDQYMRNFAFPDVNNNTPENLSWYPAKLPHAEVGTIGLYLMKYLQNDYPVPLCVINASVSGNNIEGLTNRNPSNHFDTNFYYGKLLTRLRNSGLLSTLKIMAYRQGEVEAVSNYLSCNQYPPKFETFYNQFMEDIPSLQKIYNLQNNIMGAPFDYNERAGFLRDFQRRTRDIYPNIESISTVGTTDYNGIHYGGIGYQQTAYELSKFIERDFYGSTNVDQINSPNIQYAFYNNSKDSLTLVFDEGQMMHYPADSAIYYYTRSMKDFIFLNSDNQSTVFSESNHPVVSGSAVGNKILLKLNAPSNELFVTYLPSSYKDGYSDYYNGVHIKNAKGMRAFSFYAIPILNAPPTQSNIPVAPTNLKATSISLSQINLNWIDKSNNEANFVLEGSFDGINYTIIQNIAANNLIDIEQNLLKNTNYHYRIKACNTFGCSAYSNVSVAKTMNSTTIPCIELPLNLTIANSVFNAKGTTIVANNKNILQSNVTYKATTKIILQPGFYVENNSTFRAQIEGCNN